MRLSMYLRLGRVSNLPTVWTNVFAGASLGGAQSTGFELAVVAGAASLAYTGGMFLNDAFDREIDARERPERPIPSGEVSAREVFALGFGLLLASVLSVAWLVWWSGSGEPLRAVAAAGALASFIVVYDVWHKENPLSSVIMGLCRGAVYFMAAFATGGSVGMPLVLGASTLAGYVVGLTFVARQENRRTFRGKWPLLLLAAPVGVAGVLGTMSLGAWLSVAVFVLWVLRSVLPLFFRGEVDVPRVVVSLIAGISLLDGMLGAAFRGPGFALAGLVGFFATLILQRFVRGT